MQLCIDGLCASPQEWTPEFAEELSKDIAKYAEMTIFYGPRSYLTDSLLVCFTMVAESHISLHLNRLTGMAFVDIFTCGDHGGEGLDIMVVERLKMQSPTIAKLDRGKLP